MTVYDILEADIVDDRGVMDAADANDPNDANAPKADDDQPPPAESARDLHNHRRASVNHGYVPGRSRPTILNTGKGNRRSSMFGSSS